MKKRLCIYHGNCADGFTSAWIVHKMYPDTEFYAGFYGEPPPDVTDRYVYIVDFGYKLNVMKEIVRKALHVVHIDHHDTIIKDMEGYGDVNLEKFYSPKNTESGAMLTWKYFYPYTPVPAIIKHVDDRDRWKFLMAGTRAIAANMFSYEYTFENWDLLMNQRLDQQIAEGTAIERRMAKDTKELIDVVVRRMNIAGYNVPVANVTYQYGSDLCSAICKGEPFAAYYYDKPTHREFGLRSTPGAVHVGEIAQMFGGGGHENASGFKRTFEEAQAFEIK